MVSKNRLIPAFFIIFSVILFYLLKVDYLFISLLFLLSLYDLNYSSIINKQFSLILIFLFFIFFLLKSIFLADIFLLTYLIIFFSFFISKKFYKYFFSFLILNFFFIAIILINLDRELFFLVILLSFINDTSAFLIGKYFKGPLIIPTISPNKTWSGTLGSIIFSSFLLSILNYNVLFSIIVAISFFIGDLFFSFVKRTFNIKDFSKILNGHGGILDRIDSLFISMYIFSLFKYFL